MSGTAHLIAVWVSDHFLVMNYSRFMTWHFNSSHCQFWRGSNVLESSDLMYCWVHVWAWALEPREGTAVFLVVYMLNTPSLNRSDKTNRRFQVTWGAPVQSGRFPFSLPAVGCVLLMCATCCLGRCTQPSLLFYSGGAELLPSFFRSGFCYFCARENPLVWTVALVWFALCTSVVSVIWIADCCLRQIGTAAKTHQRLSDKAWREGNGMKVQIR